MAPAVAQRNAAQLQSRRPDGAQLAQNRLQDGARGQASALSGGGECVEQPSRARVIDARENIGLGGDGGAEPTEQVDTAAAVPPEDWRRPPGSDDLGRRWSDAAASLRRRAGVGADRTRMHHRRTWRGWRAPAPRIGRPRPAASVAIFPARSGAGIEQDADDGEVEGRSRPLAAHRAMPSPGRSRPTDRDRPQRNAASARGRARRARDRLCAWSRRPGPPSHRGG